MPKILYAVMALLTLAACNTMQGAGQDVSAAGEALSSEASEAESEM
jgi:predicted small secreted protein